MYTGKHVIHFILYLMRQREVGMSKKRYVMLSVLSILTTLAMVSCVHSSLKTGQTYHSEITELGKNVHKAPVEIEIEETYGHRDPAQEILNIKGKSIDCSAIPTRIEKFNGKNYKKFNISSPDFLSCSNVKALSTSRPWLVKKEQWESSDELAYQQFIKTMGYSKCNSTDRCLSGEGNILRTEEDLLNNYYSDCADLPYYLRAYFAYKKNLPMSIVLDIAQAPFTSEQLASIEKERKEVFEKEGQLALEKFDKRLTDKRYSKNGNIPVSRLNIPNATGAERNFTVVAPQIVNIISSGFLRMVSSPPGAAVQPDFYSPKITRESIKPGTVLYQPSGHVAVVYDVTPKGEILFMDAHPDNSITRGSFNLDYKVYGAIYGGNFKNFRPLRVENPVYNDKKVIIKGQIKVASDPEIPDYSLEQYVGDGVGPNGKGIYKLKENDTKSANFHEWVKFRLSGGTYKLDPVLEMKNEVDSLCLAAQDRVISVQDAIDNKVHLQNHPQVLPQNIYGAEGEWEAYSSPSRDLRLREKILSIPEAAKSWVQRTNAKDPMIVYHGTNLKADLEATYHKAASSCAISYMKSNGQIQTVSLETIVDRVAQLSFDPYMCPEIRWGAINNAAEMATCKDGTDKKEWHRLTQFFRNTLVKDVNGVHGYSLDQLRSMDANKSIDNSDTSYKYNIANKLKAL